MSGAKETFWTLDCIDMNYPTLDWLLISAERKRKKKKKSKEFFVTNWSVRVFHCFVVMVSSHPVTVCPRLCCDGFRSSCNSLSTSFTVLLWWFQVILVDFAAQARHCSVCTTLCTLGYNWLSKQFVSVGTERCNTGVHGQHRYWLIARCWLVCGQWLRETYWQILTVRWINSKWYSLIDTDR